MFKRLAALSLIVVLLAALAPASSTVQADGPTKITFWTFVDAHAQFWQTQAERWNAGNPDRQIELEPTVYPWSDMHDRLLLALQSGVEAPDMVDIEISRFSPFVRGDIHLQPLNDIIDPVMDQLVDSRLIYQKDGTQYAIDYHVGTYLMFYNKEVMDAAGVDLDSIKTWDDYIAAGQKVSQGDVKMCPMETTGGFPEKALMLMNGGGAYDKDGNLIIDSEQNVEALQFAADLVLKYNICSVAPGGQVQSAEFYEAMNSGLYASIWEPQWYMERFQSMLPDLAGKIVVRPMPVWADKPGTFASSMGGGTGTAITDQINKNNVQLAKDFLAFGKLTYDGAVSIWVDLGFDPMFKAVYDDPALTAPLPYFGNEDVFSTIKAMQPNLV